MDSTTAQTQFLVAAVVVDGMDGGASLVGQADYKKKTNQF